MAFDVNFISGPQVYADGAVAKPTMDRTGAVRVMQAGGRWSDYARRGKLFTYSTPAAGVAVPIYSSTTQQCVLWLPSGSAVALVLKKVTFGYVSGTMVAGHLCMATQTLQTNAISGTQSALSQNNKMAGNYNVAGQNGQVAQLLTAATVVAFTYFRALNLSQFVPTAAAVAAPWNWFEDLDGSIIMLPGAAIAFAANVAAAVTATVAIEGAEVPLTELQ